MNAETIRKPAVAGAFYPAHADALQGEVDAYIEAPDIPALKGEIVAAMAPHAGYHFSAPVAAHVYKALKQVQADTVVIIGHDAHAANIVAVLSDVDAFETPLGKVAVDTDMVAKLKAAHRGIIVHNQVHRRDHTVEVHLPFLQTIMPGCKIVPVMFGDPTPEHCRIFADLLADAADGKKIFVLASTDLCHYPNDRDARKVDAETLSFVENMDVNGLFRHLEQARTAGARKNIQTAMCSSGGVGTAIIAAKAQGASHAVILDKANSSHVRGGDAERVVGYAAVLFVRPENGGAGNADMSESTKTDAAEFSVPAPVQEELLTLARNRIRAGVAGETLDYSPPEALDSILGKKAAVFVTLNKSGRLRGCIGMTEARTPLWQSVYDMAFSSAFKDWRFSPVKADELDDLTIEISVLSPLQKVDSAEEIVPAKHGVVVRSRGRGGIFLPQVWEKIPDKTRFLSVLCSEKAGLPGDAWRTGTADLLVFTVFAFEE